MTPRLERAPILPGPARVHGIVFIRKAHCKGCELCIEFCPKDVLVRSKDFNAKGYHYPLVSNGECINCRLCVTVCPEYAIFSVAAPPGARAPGAPATNHGGRA
jgi:2-oxoglutarate ferredoxin oxidoreductase subunit delta